jgi:hypothetical protein
VASIPIGYREHLIPTHAIRESPIGQGKWNWPFDEPVPRPARAAAKEQARKDRADREATISSLEEQLRRGTRSLVGNKGYRKYLAGEGPRFTIDRAKADAEARYDGHWVLQTDLELDAAAVALKYKELWQVETLFRSAKSILETRPIFHKRDETIRGRVFCSFLALVLLKELRRRMDKHGYSYEWARSRGDLDDLHEMRLPAVGRDVIVRNVPRGYAGQAFRAVGVALGPVVRFIDHDTSSASTTTD